MDVTSDTVTAGSMLSGTTATKNDGTKATGNIASKSSTDLTVSGATVTAPAGYYANAASKAVATTTHPNPSASITSSTGVVTASHTQSTGYVTGGTTTGTLNLTTQAGKTVTPTETAQTAVSSYRWTTGPVSVAAISSTYVGTGITTRSAADMTVAAQSVTAPAGYYSQAFTKAVTTTTHPNPTATIVSSTGVVTATHTQTAGYVAAGTTTGTLNLTTQGAQTITPGSTEQTIASNRWLTGTQTIEAIPSAYRIVDSEYYKATLVNDGNLGVYYTYVIYSDTQYASTGSTFYFKAGDIITCKADNLAASTVYSDGSIIYTTAAKLTYSYTTPAHPLNVLFSGRGIHFNSPTLEITSDGIHDVADYARATVVAGNAFPPAVTITKAPTIGVNTSGVVTASYTGSSSITPTVTSGYISQGTAGTISTTGTSTYQLTSKAAATYYPSTADQTIASQRWLVGNQTIKSVTTSNLTAENIAEGVVVQVGDSSNASRITQVTGTHTSGKTYTATIINTGNINYCYVQHPSSSGTMYYTDGDTFAIEEGDIIYITCAGSRAGGTIYINDIQVTFDAYNTVHYSYEVPANTNVEIRLIYGSNGLIYLNEVVDEISITQNGRYDVSEYDFADVNVTAAGFTVDQIAMNSISGAISGSSATFISPYAFYACISLTSVSFPLCTDIGSYAFYNCRVLSTVNFPSVTGIGNYAFGSCSGLTTVSFPKCTYITSYAFYYCSNLTNISFPSCGDIQSNAFSRCSALTIASFPYCSIIGINAFGSCHMLQTVYFPSCKTISTGAFYSCIRLESAIFPECTSMASTAFFGCSSLTTASFPKCTFIGSSAFNGCNLLTTTHFPLCSTIGVSAFCLCYNLTTASFPSCTAISSYAFIDCSSLTSLYLLGSSVPKLGNSAFTRTPISTSTGGVYGSIFVPASLYNSYLTATNWSVYSSRIVSV